MKPAVPVGSSAFASSKDSKARFRMTVDLRPVNAATEPIAWLMIHIDSEVYDFIGSS